MIKFFRKIRQRLLNENKFSRYFLYAIGEILLVIIGIIIALQINSWNEQRKLKDLERNYILSLIDDLNSDIEDIIESIKTNPDMEAAINGMIHSHNRLIDESYRRELASVNLIEKLENELN